MLGEIEHRDIAVRVASRQDPPAAGAAPDPERLLRAIIEVVGLGLVRDRATLVVAGVLERGRAANYPVTGIPYTSWLIGRMKSRPPPEAM